MGTEPEIHLGQRELLILDAVLWLAASIDLFKYVLNRPIYLSDPWPSLCILFILGWLVLLMLHTARVLYNRIEKLMSEEQLYELARKRIDRRNRRWIGVGLNFLAFVIFVGAFTMFYDGVSHKLGAFIALAWIGVLALHVIILSVTQNRDQAIDSEVAKLRDLVYDKPKHLELSDDGELVDFAEAPSEKIERTVGQNR